MSKQAVLYARVSSKEQENVLCFLLKLNYADKAIQISD